GSGTSASSTTEKTGASIETRVVRVIDGDTIAVEPTEDLEATDDAGDEHTVRLLGIDAPEMNVYKSDPPECGAQEAADNLAAVLDEDAPVTLVYDVESDHTDHYGRSLTYVSTETVDDLAAEQVADGYAMARYPSSEPTPQRYDDYVAMSETAAERSAGAHGQCGAIGR